MAEWFQLDLERLERFILGRKRKITKPTIATPNLDVAAKLGEARQILSEGVERCAPHKLRFKNLAEGADACLAVMERLSRGEITADQSLLEYERLRARFPLPRLNPPPPWFPPDIAWALLKLVEAAQKKYPQAPQEFLEWLRPTKPRGRPPDMKLSALYQRAARMRMKGSSWMQITRKLCSSRSLADHRCTRQCLDRIRMGVREYAT